LFKTPTQTLESRKKSQTFRIAFFNNKIVQEKNSPALERRRAVFVLLNKVIA